MSKPYTTQTISGFNASPPADDGSIAASNEIEWQKHLDKIGTPVKDLAEDMNTELLSAFGLIFGQNISSHSGDYTVVAGDQGKFLDVTGTTTITLLAAATAGASFALAIINNGTGVVTVDGNGAETINGSATITLNPGSSIILTCNATLWVGAEAKIEDTKGADIASATTTDIGVAGDFVNVTGSTTITGFGTVAEGVKRTVRYTGAPLLTYNATSLITPMGVDYQVVAGDVLEQLSLGSGNWIITDIMERHGTWTPTIQDNSLSDGEGQTYSVQYGSYTKVGNRVFISGKLIITSLGTLTTGNLARIAGLPFTSSSTSNEEGSVYFGLAVGTSKVAAGNTWTGHIDESTSYIRIYDWDSVTATTNVLVSEVSATGHIVFSGQYLV